MVRTQTFRSYMPLQLRFPELIWLMYAPYETGYLLQPHG